jgi:hypothetical protein
MNRLAIKFFLALLTLSVTAGAGGTIPSAGYGTTYGGYTYLPKSDDEITWSAYGAPLTDPVLRDVVAFATASVDRETQGFRLLHDAHPELSDYHVYFSFVGGAPNAKCLDDVPGGCTLGDFTCLQWQVEGAYRMCTQGKIRIYAANIATGGDLVERLPNVIRHEWAHALGFDHGDGGPMENGGNEFTACQLAQMRDFDYDAASQEWVVAVPMECE